jgi:putative peptide zinc metalloprotease protein
MISSNASSMMPSTQRPIPLKAREDLGVHRIEYRGIGSWVIKDPVGLKYYRLQPEQYAVLILLNNERNLEQIRDEVQRQFPTLRLTLSDIQHLITDLHQKGLVYSHRPGQGVSLIKHHREQRKKKIFATARNLLYLRLPGWDPERTLQFLYPYVKFMFRPWAIVLAMMLVASSWVLLGVQFHEFRSQVPKFEQFFAWPNLMYLWITLSFAKILHEFGHGLSCKHFGGECHEMGVMLLVFSPCLYCDVSDSWTLPNKWKRFIIGGAGMYIEVILAAIAVWVWWYTQPGLLKHLCLNLFFVSTITTVIFNANPLMRFDGYYMLSDLLEIPNLRPKADRMLRDTFAWYCLGIESRPDPFMPETGKFWFVLFAISAAIYRWVILFGITLFLYTVLKPYGLQSIGITLAVISLTSIIGSQVFNVYKIVSAPRIEPMSYRKITATIVVTAGLAVAALQIPLPLHTEASFIVEPHKVEHVYTAVPGRLEEMHVEAGRQVRQGDLLLVLSHPEKEDRYRELRKQADVESARMNTYHALGRDAQEALAMKKRETLEEQIDDYKQQLEQLRIKAPCDGVVVAPPLRPEPKLDATQGRLNQWSGVPIDQKNRGAFLEERTHVLSVAPNDRYQAIVLIDQADRNDVREGQKVELRFDNLPERIYEGVVEDISDRPLEFVPEVLSNKLGGDLPTMTDSQGRERLMSPAYQATILLEEDTRYLKSGMRGLARFSVPTRTAGQWLWRYLRQTFHFRL